MAGRIDFAQLNAALLSAAERLVPAWLPEGHREGHEWRCGGLSGRAGSSMAVNLHTGIWADFATEDKGGDLIALYAAIHGLTQIEAARQLAADMHIEPVPAGAQPAPASTPTPEPARKSEWTPIVPVPEIAGNPPASHFRFGTASRTWSYEWDGELFGHVQRFDRIDSKGKPVKEVLPLTFCRNEHDGSMKWHYKQWEAPRPLYLPSGFLNPARTVIVVEGEKCADALHDVLGNEFDVVSWPGGGKAVQYADWSWIKNRKVLLWPDADSKRLSLPKSAPADQDPDSMPYKALEKQPGVTAMVAAGRLLLDLDCDVYMLPVPDPGVLPDGYDVADMIEQGATVDAVRERLREGRREVLYQFAPDLRPGGASTPAAAGAQPDEGEDPNAWKLQLLRTDKGA